MNKHFFAYKVIFLVLIISMSSVIPLTKGLSSEDKDQSANEFNYLTDITSKTIPKESAISEVFTPKQISVAVLDSASSDEPAYFAGGWSNDYITIYNGLVANGIQTKVITNAEIISGGLSDVDVLIMIDNVPSTSASLIVSNWCATGGNLLTFDSSICFNNWAGLLPPEAVGTSGSSVYWEYSSPSMGIYTNYHPIMNGYTIGQTIYGTSGDSQYYSTAMLSSSIGSHYCPIVKSNVNNDRDLIVAYDSPTLGRIVHIWDAHHWSTTTNQLLIMNSIYWLGHETVDFADSSIEFDAPDLKYGNSMLLNVTAYNTGSESFTNVELQLWINNNLVNTTIYPTLDIGENITLQYTWLPTLIGTYNITAYVVPEINETYIFNNKITRFVNVFDPTLKIGFINTHGEYMEGQTYLQSYYQNLGYTVDHLYETLTEDLVEQYRFLFVGENGGSWLASEITIIENFIAAGGTFVGIGDSTASDGVVQIASNNGITFRGSYFGYGGITANINTDNDLMKGVNSVYIPNIFNSLELTGAAVEMFRDSTNVDILGASVKIGSGLLCILCDDFAGVVYNEDNEIMFANLLTSVGGSLVKLIFPKGGEVLSGVFNITWNCTDLINGDLNYTVYLWDCYNTLWLPLIEDTNETSLEFNSTLYLDGNAYKVKVVATNGTHTDFASSSSFTINNYNEAPSVMIVYPTGGDYFDTYVLIHWIGTDPDLDLLTYTIYYRNTTSSWIEIDSELITTNYYWSTISIKNGDYYIRIVVSDGTLEDEYTILSSIHIQHPNHYPEITLSQPIGGGIYSGNVTISWAGSDIDADTLTYNIYYWNNVVWKVIALGLSNNSFIWDSTKVPNGEFYQIRVLVSDGSATSFDTTDSTITILNEKTKGFGIPLPAVTTALVIGFFIILLNKKRKK